MKQGVWTFDKGVLPVGRILNEKGKEMKNNARYIKYYKCIPSSRQKLKNDRCDTLKYVTNLIILNADL